MPGLNEQVKLPDVSLPSEARPPLGLPNGSIRALLTLLVVAVVIVQVVRGGEVEAMWVETLMIAMAHYFTSRRFIDLAPEMVRQLEAEGRIETESNPLYLPRHSVRVILVLAFVGLTIYLYRDARLFQLQSLSILGVIFAYLLGIVVRSFVSWWSRSGHTQGIRGWEDVKAIVVLCVLAYTAGAYLLDRPDLVPKGLRSLTLGLVLFYFGSR